MTATIALDALQGLGTAELLAGFDEQLALDPLDKSCPDEIPCRVLDSELWFADSPADIERAKGYCAGCPARLGCLTGALERREPWGVWGGEFFERGVVVPRKRPRGRPRKDERRNDEQRKDEQRPAA